MVVLVCWFWAAGALVVRLEGGGLDRAGEASAPALLKLAAGPFVAECWKYDRRVDGHGIETVIFGGWAEELRGLCAERPHGDIDHGAPSNRKTRWVYGRPGRWSVDWYAGV
jgi:hypothetical protein